MTIWSKKDIEEYRVEEGTQPSSYSYYNPYMSFLETPISYKGNVVEIINLSYGGMYRSLKWKLEGVEKRSVNDAKPGINAKLLVL